MTQATDPTRTEPEPSLFAMAALMAGLPADDAEPDVISMVAPMAEAQAAEIRDEPCTGPVTPFPHPFA